MRLANDPGHGGRDRGACRGTFEEATFALVAGHMLASTLYRTGWPVEVKMVRADDLIDPSQAHRAQIAAEFQADLVLSLHVNAGPPGEHGPLVFYHAGDELAREVGDAIIREMHRPGEYKDEAGVVKPMRSHLHPLKPPILDWQQNAWAVISPHSRPVVLFETEYCSHVPSRDWLMTSEGLDRVVAACVAGVGRALFLRGELSI